MAATAEPLAHIVRTGAGLRRLHVVVGAAGVVAFAGTGVFMAVGFPALYDANDAIRFTFRANHIYLLFASLMNLALAAYLPAWTPGWRGACARAGSRLLLIAPFVLWAAFLIEGPTGAPERPLTFVGVLLVLAGVALHAPNRSRAAAAR